MLRQTPESKSMLMLVLDADADAACCRHAGCIRMCDVHASVFCFWKLHNAGFN